MKSLGIKRLILLFLLVACSIRIAEATSLDGTTNISYQNGPGPYAFSSGDYATGFVYLQQGFTAAGPITLQLCVPLNGPIGFAGAGLSPDGGVQFPSLASPANVINLADDLYLGANIQLTSNIVFVQNSASPTLCEIVLNEDLNLTSILVFTVGTQSASNYVINGNGHSIIFNGGAIYVDSNVTLTFKNIELFNIGQDNSGNNNLQTNPADDSSSITFQNCQFYINNSTACLLQQGQFFFGGTNSIRSGILQYQPVTTSSTMQLNSGGQLIFDQGTTLMYDGSAAGSITQISFEQQDSGYNSIYFKGCTVQAPNSGWQITGGDIFLSDYVTIQPSPTSSSATNGISFGGSVNSTNVQPMGGAEVMITQGWFQVA